MSKIYGVVVLDSGLPMNPGFTLQAIKDLAGTCVGEECDIGDIVCDLAIAPQLLYDLVEHIEELEAKLGSQNIKA